MLKTYSLTKNTLLVSSESNIKNSSVVYVYGDELLSNMVLHDVDNFMQEVLLKIMQKDFHVMLDDLRGVKEKIDDLDSEISTSGSLRPTFGDLLTLQKYMIALSTTYGANHKALDFIKKNFTTINDIDFTTQKIVDEIYNTSDTMDRIILGYSQYLDYLENMINNMISYQLNMIMKTLTEISIVLTIPAIIFGFWGVNVDGPFEKSSYGVFAVLIISVILSLICWFLLRRKTYL